MVGGAGRVGGHQSEACAFRQRGCPPACPADSVCCWKANACRTRALAGMRGRWRLILGSSPHRTAPHHITCHAVLTSCLFLQHSACRWWCTWGPPTRSACSPPCCLSKPSTSAGPGRQAGARHEPHRCRRLQLPRPCPCRLPLVVPALPRCTAAGAALQSPPVQAQQRLSDFQPSSVCVCVCVCVCAGPGAAPVVPLQLRGGHYVPCHTDALVWHNHRPVGRPE